MSDVGCPIQTHLPGSTDACAAACAGGGRYFIKPQTSNRSSTRNEGGGRGINATRAGNRSCQGQIAPQRLQKASMRDVSEATAVMLHMASRHVTRARERALLYRRLHGKQDTAGACTHDPHRKSAQFKCSSASLVASARTATCMRHPLQPLQERRAAVIQDGHRLLTGGAFGAMDSASAGQSRRGPLIPHRALGSASGMESVDQEDYMRSCST